MNTVVEAQIIAEIHETKELLQDAMNAKHPQPMIKLYEGIMTLKSRDLKLLKAVETVRA
jgi:hypothetical protein